MPDGLLENAMTNVLNDRWMGAAEARLAAVERDFTGLRLDVGGLRADVVTRSEATRTYIDNAFSRLGGEIRQDLAAHMRIEETQQREREVRESAALIDLANKHEELQGSLARIERWRWGAMGVLGFAGWLLGMFSAFKWW